MSRDWTATIDRALAELDGKRLVRKTMEETGGRKAEVWYPSSYLLYDHEHVHEHEHEHVHGKEEAPDSTGRKETISIHAQDTGSKLGKETISGDAQDAGSEGRKESILGRGRDTFLPSRDGDAQAQDTFLPSPQTQEKKKERECKPSAHASALTWEGL